MELAWCVWSCPVDPEPSGWSWSTWLTNASSALTIIGTLLAIVVVVRLWFPVRRVARLRRARLREALPAAGRRSLVGQEARVEAFLSRDARQVTHELTWLNSALGGSPRTTLLDLLSRDRFEDLSRRYSEIAGQMLRANALDPSRPLMSEMAALHRETAAELALVANSETIPSVQAFLPLAPDSGRGLARIALAKKNLVLELVVYPGRVGGHVVYDCLAHVSENELTQLLPPRSRETYDGHYFDGVLPALNSARLQKDARTGRVRLALSLTPVRYSDIERDHFYAAPQHDEVQARVDPRARVARPRDSRHPAKGTATGSTVGLLTCSFIPVTSDGYLVLVERGASAGAHAGDVGPAVTGNLDLAPRSGSWVDRLPSGCPDLRLAIQREAQEEIGLHLPVESIYVNALARFTSTSETNSNVLCATAMIEESLEEVAACIRRSDLGEGRWEVGGRLLGLKLPSAVVGDAEEKERFDARVRQIMRWLLTTADLPPHAAANGWAAIATALNLPGLIDDFLAEIAGTELEVTDRAVESRADFVRTVAFHQEWA